MQSFLACLRKDLRRWLRDRAALAFWVGVPVFAGLLLALLFGRGEARPRGVLLVADQDQTFLSRLVALALARGESGTMLSVLSVGLEEGEQRIRKGDGSALLVIPEGFTRRFLEGEAQTLRLLANPAQAILPEAAREAAEILAEAGWYLQQALGEELRALAAAPAWPGEDRVAALAARASRLMRESSAYLDPPLITLERRSAQPRPRSGMAQAMAPGVVFMTLLLMAFGLSADLWEEKAAGTLRRTAASPVSPAAQLASKTAAAAILMGAITATALAGVLWLTGGSPRTLPLAALWTALAGCALFLLMALAQMVCRSERQGRTLANVAALVLILAGGAMFPLETLPAGLARIGRLTPNGWALEELRAILAGQAVAMPWKFAALLVLIGLLIASGALRMRRRFLA